MGGSETFQIRRQRKVAFLDISNLVNTNVAAFIKYQPQERERERERGGGGEGGGGGGGVTSFTLSVRKIKIG